MQHERPPAGYYPDPTHPGHERWWDGDAWAVIAEHLQVAAPPKITPPDPGPPRTNQFAMASLALSIAWVFFVGSILGVIFGHLAMKQIRESHHQETGRGNAMIGLILGYTGITSGLLMLITLTN